METTLQGFFYERKSVKGVSFCTSVGLRVGGDGGGGSCEWKTDLER